MTADVLKRDVSLTVLKVRLGDGEIYGTPPPGGAPAQQEWTQQKTSCSKRRIHLELQVTGNAEERGFVSPTVTSSNRAPSRRRDGSNIRPSYTSLDSTMQAAPSRTLAQWSLAPEEMHLPLHVRAAVDFREKTGLIREFVANAARAAVAALFTQMRADELERFAAATSWLPSGNPTLPSWMGRQLRALLPSVLQPGDCLWLEFAEPRGYLPLLPWE